MRKIETFSWWNDLLKLKDQYSLRELADRFDVTPGAITAAFKRTGTSRRSAPPGPRNRRPASAPPPVVEELLPPEPGDGADADPAGRPGSKDTRIATHAALLGTVPDAEVARKAGVSVRTVAAYRARVGIPGYTGPRRRGADRQPRKSRIDAFADLVGTVPDRVVAERAKVSVNAVRNWRVKRHVKARGRAAEVAAPAAAAVAAVPSTGSQAYRVVVGGDERAVRVVVAASLSAAAAHAESAGLGPILAVEWLGEVV